MGLREQKKNKTRKMISDIATRLFVERGYSEVTTSEIAEKAEVSVPTLFKYFPTKESLIFDEDKEREARLIDLVINRGKGISILDALLQGGISTIDRIEPEHLKHVDGFRNLIDTTPELSLYSKQMWTRHEQSLAAVIRKESRKKIEKIESEVIAHFVLDAFSRSLCTSKPKASLKALFRLLRNGWAE